jgi:hypothetical protein
MLAVFLLASLVVLAVQGALVYYGAQLIGVQLAGKQVAGVLVLLAAVRMSLGAKTTFTSDQKEQP